MRPITADEEFSKNKELKTEDVEHLRQWMADQPHLPKGVTDEQLILFLHCSQSRLEDCKKVIESYYTIRTHYPEIFGNRDPEGDGVQQWLSISEISHFPKIDQQGNAAIAVRMRDSDASKFSHIDSLKTFFMAQDAIMVETGTVSGYVFLLDVTGFSVWHLPRIKVSYMKLFAEYIQDAFPGNVVAIHILNVNYISKAILSLLMPFIRKELSRKMFVHTSMDTLYEHVSRDALPEDYGGSRGKMKAYHEMTVQQLERCSSWFKKEEAFRVDETKRT